MPNSKPDLKCEIEDSARAINAEARSAQVCSCSRLPGFRINPQSALRKKFFQKCEAVFGEAVLGGFHVAPETDGAGELLDFRSETFDRDATLVARGLTCEDAALEGVPA